MFVSFDASLFEGLMASPFEKVKGYRLEEVTDDFCLWSGLGR